MSKAWEASNINSWHWWNDGGVPLVSCSLLDLVSFLLISTYHAYGLYWSKRVEVFEHCQASQLTMMLMQHDYEESSYITSQVQCFEGHFISLRTVEFKNTAGDYQSWEHGCFDLPGFFSGSQGVYLLNLLNKSSKLEYVVFATNNQKQAFRLKNKESDCWVPRKPWKQNFLASIFSPEALAFKFICSSTIRVWSRRSSGYCIWFSCIFFY